MTNALIPIEKVNALEVFTGKELDKLLETVRSAAISDSYDLTTDTGRKDIASRAYAVSRSKTAIDSAGKELVSEWKEKAKSFNLLFSPYVSGSSIDTSSNDASPVQEDRGGGTDPELV